MQEVRLTGALDLQGAAVRRADHEVPAVPDLVLQELEGVGAAVADVDPMTAGGGRADHRHGGVQLLPVQRRALEEGDRADPAKDLLGLVDCQDAAVLDDLEVAELSTGDTRDGDRVAPQAYRHVRRGPVAGVGDGECVPVPLAGDGAGEDGRLAVSPRCIRL